MEFIFFVFFHYTGNKIAAVTSANALQAGPAIYQWDIDMNTGIHYLHIS
jgi:hypothetical protein